MEFKRTTTNLFPSINSPFPTDSPLESTSGLRGINYCISRIGNGRTGKGATIMEPMPLLHAQHFNATPAHRPMWQGISRIPIFGTVGLLFLSFLIAGCSVFQGAKPISTATIAPTPLPTQVPLPTTVLKWQKDLPAGSGPFLMDNNVLYTSTDQQIYALNATTGASLWKHSLSSNASLYLDGGSLDVVTFPTYFVLDSATGATRTTLDLRNFFLQGFSLGAVASNTLYMRTNTTAIAVNGNTGALIWKTSLPFTSTSQISSAFAPFTVADGLLFINGVDGTFAAIDLQTGHLLWTFATVAATSSETVIFDPAVVLNGVVYFFSELGAKYMSDTAFVYAIQLSNHQLLWKKHVNMSFGVNIVATANQLLVRNIVSVDTNDEQLLSLDPATGDIQRQFENLSFVLGNYVADGTFIYTAGLSQMGIIDLQGLGRFELLPLGQDLSWDFGPQVQNGVLYIATQHSINNVTDKVVLLAFDLK